MVTKDNLTAKETALYLGIGMNSMQSLLHSNGFPAFKIGRRWIINKRALDTWILNKCNDNV